MNFVPDTGNFLHVTGNITCKHIAFKIPLMINSNFSDLFCVIIFWYKAFAYKTQAPINFASGTDNLYSKPVACYTFIKDCLFSMEWETGADGGQFLRGGQSSQGAHAATSPADETSTPDPSVTGSREVSTWEHTSEQNTAHTPGGGDERGGNSFQKLTTSVGPRETRNSRTERLKRVPPRH